jgi:hypothetical protein
MAIYEDRPWPSGASEIVRVGASLTYSELIKQWSATDLKLAPPIPDRR